MKKPLIFISHISEEAELAKIFQQAVCKDFLKLVDVFVSSDTASIAAGSNWLRSIERALDEACMVIVLCSSASIRREWVQFEAGAAWIRKIPVIPLCHTGFRPRDLPMPLSVLQAVEAGQKHGLGKLYNRIAKELECGEPPSGRIGRLCLKVRAFEATHVLKIDSSFEKQTSRERDIWARMKEALSDKTYKWRTIERLAVKGGITTEEAFEILRQKEEVEFGRNSSGARLARLTD